VKRAALLIALVLCLLAATPAAAGEKVTRAEAIAAADSDPKVRAEEREHGELGPSASFQDGHWEVAYFAGGEELALVLVDAHSGEVTESWTGYQVAWKMARGYSGAFGH
jgi:hypothetical protein